MTEAELQQLERSNLINALKACNGKLFGSGGAAELLGIKPTTMASHEAPWAQAPGVRPMAERLRSALTP